MRAAVVKNERKHRKKDTQPLCVFLKIGFIGMTLVNKIINIK